MKKIIFIVVFLLAACGHAPSNNGKNTLSTIENARSEVYCRNGWQVIIFAGGLMLDIDRAGNKIPCNENVTAPPPNPQKSRL
jgi:hypothetical protein